MNGSANPKSIAGNKIAQKGKVKPNPVFKVVLDGYFQKKDAAFQEIKIIEADPKNKPSYSSHHHEFVRFQIARVIARFCNNVFPLPPIAQRVPVEVGGNHQVPLDPLAIDDADARQVYVADQDSLSLVKDLLDSAQIKKVALLNMANRSSVLGDLFNGSLAQEEGLGCTTDLSASLLQYAKEHKGEIQLDSRGNARPFYGKNSFNLTDVLYSENRVYFQKDDKEDFFNQLQENDRYQVNIITSAGIRYNQDTKDHYEILDLKTHEMHYFKKEDAMKLYFAIIYNQVRTAIVNGNEALVLSAFGCGAFKNQPEDISEIYRTILSMPEFIGKIYFIFGIYKSEHTKNLEVFEAAFKEPLVSLSEDDAEKIRGMIREVKDYKLPEPKPLPPPPVFKPFTNIFSGINKPPVNKGPGGKLSPIANGANHWPPRKNLQVPTVPTKPPGQVIPQVGSTSHVFQMTGAQVSTPALVNSNANQIQVPQLPKAPVVGNSSIVPQTSSAVSAHPLQQSAGKGLFDENDDFVQVNANTRFTNLFGNDHEEFSWDDTGWDDDVSTSGAVAGPNNPFAHTTPILPPVIHHAPVEWPSSSGLEVKGQPPQVVQVPYSGLFPSVSGADLFPQRSQSSQGSNDSSQYLDEGEGDPKALEAARGSLRRPKPQPIVGALDSSLFEEQGSDSDDAEAAKRVQAYYANLRRKGGAQVTDLYPDSHLNQASNLSELAIDIHPLASPQTNSAHLAVNDKQGQGSNNRELSNQDPQPAERLNIPTYQSFNGPQDSSGSDDDQPNSTNRLWTIYMGSDPTQALQAPLAGTGNANLSPPPVRTPFINCSLSRKKLLLGGLGLFCTAFVIYEAVKQPSSGSEFLDTLKFW